MATFNFFYCYGGPHKGANTYNKIIEAENESKALEIFKSLWKYEEIYSITEVEEPAPIENYEFIQSVETQDTGGNIINDLIILKNGMRIRISSDIIGIYANEEKDDEGEAISYIPLL